VFKFDAAGDPAECDDDRIGGILGVFRFDAAADPIECDDDRDKGLCWVFVFDAIAVSIESDVSGREERVSREWRSLNVSRWLAQCCRRRSWRRWKSA
jgi:hypothetical protein